MLIDWLGVGECGTLSVVLPTPHDYSGTFQGYSARFTASRRVLKGARRVLYPLKAA